MEKEKPSATAEATAAYRAVESLKPENECVCYDPLAKDFLGTGFKTLIGNRILRKILLWYVDRITPGAIGCVVGRTRYVDDYLTACIREGLKQLVISGAGYDSRAYRFGELKEKVRVFEIDHPATQSVKIEKVRRIFGSLPDHITYVPIDFNKEKLDDRLFESGYDRNLKTMFIWEGVSMYLTAEAVDETLSFVTNNSGKGSSIIFNYILKSVLDGTCDLEYVDKIRKAHERREPFRFGIEEGTIDEFLSERGFHRVNNVTGYFFKNSYFKGANQNRKVCCLCGFVHATVNQSLA